MQTSLEHTEHLVDVNMDVTNGTKTQDNLLKQIFRKELKIREDTIVLVLADGAVQLDIECQWRVGITVGEYCGENTMEGLDGEIGTGITIHRNHETLVDIL